METTLPSAAAAEALLRRVAKLAQRDLAETHPAHLLRYAKGVDAKTGESFEFRVGDEDRESGWHWQREVLDWWIENDKTIILKARQLGITWLAGGYALWLALYKPGTRVLCVSINEAEASKVVNRIWDMYESLPEHLRNNVEVLKPSKGHRPYDQIQFRHRGGQISAILGLPSTKKAGHGETAALVILDEAARQEYAAETWKAVIPTMAGGGKIFVISTANGVSNALTGEGNFFHHLWVNADSLNLEKRFLTWWIHPDRDDAWYLREAMSLPAKDRAEQFPADENEAFILTGDLYFDQEALLWYGKNAVPEPLYRMRFVKGRSSALAKIHRDEHNGETRVYEEPSSQRVQRADGSWEDVPHTYAIGADVATGRGTDFSCAYVVNLQTMNVAAEFHAKCDADQFAYQLHFLGRWYNTARIAVETGGGYGDAPIIFLRDGREGRPPYPKLYRHRQATRPDLAEHKPFGFPMNSKTRTLVLEYLEKLLRERDLPALPDGLLKEMQTFVHRSTNPSPRAQDGCNDDRVMAAAISTEMFRQYGHHPERKKRRGKPGITPYPWQETG